MTRPCETLDSFIIKLIGCTPFKKAIEFLNGVPGECYMFISQTGIQFEIYNDSISSILTIPRRSFSAFSINTTDKIFLILPITTFWNILKEGFKKVSALIIQKLSDQDKIRIYPEYIGRIKYEIDYSVDVPVGKDVEIPPEIYRISNSDYINTLSSKEFCSTIKLSNQAKKDSLRISIYTNRMIGIYKSCLRSTSTTIIGEYVDDDGSIIDNIDEDQLETVVEFNMPAILSKSMCKLHTLAAESNIIIYSNDSQIMFLSCVGGIGLLYIIFPI